MAIEAGDPEGVSVRVSESTVVWFGTDTPLTYSCRACGRVVYKDVSGKPVYEVYPSPVLCSAECSARFLATLLPPEWDEWEGGEPDEEPDDCPACHGTGEVRVGEEYDHVLYSSPCRRCVEANKGRSFVPQSPLR